MDWEYAITLALWGLIELAGFVAAIIMWRRADRQVMAAQKWERKAGSTPETRGMRLLAEDRRSRNGTLAIVMGVYLLLVPIVLLLMPVPLVGRSILVGGQALLVMSAWRSIRVGDQIEELMDSNDTPESEETGP